MHRRARHPGGAPARHAAGVHVPATIGWPIVPVVDVSETVGSTCRRGRWSWGEVADETNIPGFGAWVRERLHARRMSQRQLARRAAVHPSTVSRVLRGAVPTLATALALQDALDPPVPSGVEPDAPELHPALLSAML